MLHARRVWNVRASPTEAIAEQLSGDAHTFTLCTGMATPSGTVLVNDSTGEGSIQEYAVLRRVVSRWVQVESLTTTWCTRRSLSGLLEQADRGEWDDHEPWAVVRNEQLEHGNEPCDLCR